MVSPFTLGLFAPLPLAMMIPFMATQSLAMGEAFGKSFQYGKRKISSMTNEEFNKLTFSDLMDQQTANIRSIIPKLEQQMHDSSEMQSQIFREMTKLIPAFIEGLGLSPDNSFTPTQGTADTINSNVASQNKFLDSLSNLFFKIPEAHATDQTSIQTFTQAEQNLQDNPPSNIPLTLQGMTKKEIADAYSDMLSGRISLTTKQKQELTLAFKSSSFVKSTPETFTAIKDPTNQASLTYHSTKISLLIRINEINSAKPIGTGRFLLDGRNINSSIKKNKLSQAKKALQNHITQARNIAATKAEANNDWNKRIWNL